VHEAWLRLGGDVQPNWQNRGHFFAAAAEAMRRISSSGPGAGAAQHRARAEHIDLRRLTCPRRCPMTNSSGERGAGQAFRKIGQGARGDAEVFAGLSNEDVARSLGVSERTVETPLGLC